MKKVMGLLLCIFLMMSSACTDMSTTPPNAPTTTSSVMATASTTTTSTAGKTTDTTTVTVSTTAKSTTSRKTTTTKTEKLAPWKQIYLLYAKEAKDTFTHFALIHINDDDIPELYMYNGEYAQVRGWFGNTGYYRDLQGVGGANYEPKSGKFMNVYTEGSRYVMQVYEMDGYFREVFFGTEYKEPDGSKTYYIGNSLSSVAEDEFIRTVNEYIDTSKVVYMHKNALTYEEFQQAVVTW